MKFSGVSWRIAAIPTLCACRIPKSSLHPENEVQAAFACQNLLKSVPLIFHAFQAV